MAAIVVAPLPGAGPGVRLAAHVRGLWSRRLLLRLAGVDSVVLEGRTYPVRARPLGVARELVPALIRCSRRFADWQFDEALYDDIVVVLALGLDQPPSRIERLTVALWDLAPVIDVIARTNGIPTVEAGGATLGKLLAALATTPSTGTASTPTSSTPPAGHGTTSTDS